MVVFIGRHWKKLIIVALLLPLAAYVGLSLLIGHGVRTAVSFAQAEEPGGPVEALMQVAATEKYGLKDRNRAIWALGQLGDPAALPVLEGLATGGECNHAAEVCQKEVRKAVEACRGGTNISAPLWRQGELAGGGGAPEP